MASEKIGPREWREVRLSESAVPAGATTRERMRHKLRTAACRAQYDKRKVTVEPVCGPLKEVIGLRQFLLRGLANVRGEWRLGCTAHNLLELWRACRSGVTKRAEVLAGRRAALPQTV